MATAMERVYYLMLEKAQLIIQLRRDMSKGATAWDEGEDHFAMAEFDPSDQYIASLEIENLSAHAKSLFNGLSELDQANLKSNIIDSFDEEDKILAPLIEKEKAEPGGVQLKM